MNDMIYNTNNIGQLTTISLTFYRISHSLSHALNDEETFSERYHAICLSSINPNPDIADSKR